MLWAWRSTESWLVSETVWPTVEWLSPCAGHCWAPPQTLRSVLSPSGQEGHQGAGLSRERAGAPCEGGTVGGLSLEKMRLRGTFSLPAAPWQEGAAGWGAVSALEWWAIGQEEMALGCSRGGLDWDRQEFLHWRDGQALAQLSRAGVECDVDVALGDMAELWQCWVNDSTWWSWWYFSTKTFLWFHEMQVLWLINCGDGNCDFQMFPVSSRCYFGRILYCSVSDQLVAPNASKPQRVTRYTLSRIIQIQWPCFHSVLAGPSCLYSSVCKYYL